MIVPMGTALKDLIPGYFSIFSKEFLKNCFSKKLLEMKRRAGWHETLKTEDILMFEDRHLGNCKHLDKLEKSLESALQFFRSTPPSRDIHRNTTTPQADAEDGAVIIFQVT